MSHNELLDALKAANAILDDQNDRLKTASSSRVHLDNIEEVDERINLLETELEIVLGLKAQFQKTVAEYYNIRQQKEEEETPPKENEEVEETSKIEKASAVMSGILAAIDLFKSRK